MISKTCAMTFKNVAPPARRGIWIREIALSLAVTIRSIAMFALAIGFSLLLAMKFGQGNLWIATLAAVGFLLFIVLPVRLWWAVGKSQ